jgi:hypothetical protein
MCKRQPRNYALYQARSKVMDTDINESVYVAPDREPVTYDRWF